MSYVLDAWLPAHFDRGASNDSIEDFLQDIHRDIAVAFRSKDAGIMPFLVSVKLGYENTGSTLPVVLHRGLGLPVMVVEQGTMDRFTDEGEPYRVSVNDLRVAAPIGSELAEQIQSFEGQLETDPEAVVSLLEKFTDKPIIWLEHGTYSLYLPKHSTQAEVQSEITPDVDSVENAVRPSTPPAEPSPPGSPDYPHSPRKGWGDSARNLWHQFSGRGSP